MYRGQQVGLRVREGNKLRHEELELRVAGKGGPTPEGRHGEEDQAAQRGPSMVLSVGSVIKNCSSKILAHFFEIFKDERQKGVGFLLQGTLPGFF